nr:MAG TPA: hypothetical protein [Caudoviricetes sp.]
MIKCLNKFGEEVKMIDFVELQWSRKYFECGSFVLYMAAKDYDPDVKYIQCIGRPETAMVQKVVYEEKNNGEFVTLSGFFIDKVLDWSAYTIPISTVTFTGKAEVKKKLTQWLLETVSDKYAKQGDVYEKTNWNVIGGTVSGAKLSVDSDVPNLLSISAELGESTGSAMRKALKSAGYTLICRPIFSSKEEPGKPLLGIELHIQKGRDLRDDVFFGEAWGNISKCEYACDESGIYSGFLASQEIPDDFNTSNEVHGFWKDGKKVRAIHEYVQFDNNVPSNLGHCIPFKVFNASISGVEIKSENEALIRSKMRDAARLEMLNNYKQETISVDVLQHRFYYLKDYDLGDICTINIDSIQKEFTSRLVEVREVHAKNKVDIELVFGTPNRQTYRKVDV